MSDTQRAAEALYCLSSARVHNPLHSFLRPVALRRTRVVRGAVRVTVSVALIAAIIAATYAEDA